MRSRTLCLALALAPLAPGPARAQTAPPAATDLSAAQEALFDKGQDLIRQGRPADAIAQYLDRLIADFAARYGNSAKRIYCAHGPAEEKLYRDDAARDQVDAVVLASTWADALFLKGYALIDLNRFPEAKLALERALALSPRTPNFIVELGHCSEVMKDWPAALALYRRAEDAVRVRDGATPNPASITRTWRGQGYCLTEMGRLEEATRLYKRCLELDPGDLKAQGELEYIQQLKTKASG